MALYGRLLYAWLLVLVFSLQAFRGGFAHSCCSDNNGGCDPNALCSEDPNTGAMTCTCNVGYANTGSDDNVVCTVNIPADAEWESNGMTIAGGNGKGNAANQLFWPGGLFVDDNQTVVIADFGNHRIMQWKHCDRRSGKVVAGGNGQGIGLHQLNLPTDVLIDTKTNSLIICDWGNRRVVRWSRHRDNTQGEVLISNTQCWGLAMDEQRNLYVSDIGKHEVRRYRLGEQTGTVVAGGNGCGCGNALNQLSNPTYLFVDREHSVYVSDKNNHRVMKWKKGATQGILAAAGKGFGCSPTQLNSPQGLFVDASGTVYVVDSANHRVMRFTKRDTTQGTVVVGGNGAGALANQLITPFGLTFDQNGKLYVVDNNNHRIQRYSLQEHC
ncbi:unnamed protein product [Rotaria socialis]|uniref:NELL2-like EGF domain-containing protein n=2 Tax=Rotaria socialis TaxID=392032 RepID=A0A820V5B3_9BILA|nr:unnamed protein product [Rotaria socialis]CAF4495796.1 unnamed protein product [Rotaria socialis]CAF4601911.1 unnamed protein product [Rotaria socialis]CAF4802078.1 unnamed protein product [Rotaria socialis]